MSNLSKGQLGDLFEDQWANEISPENQIAQFLGDRCPNANSMQRVELLLELAGRDFSLRLQTGLQVTPDEYIAKFPELANLHEAGPYLRAKATERQRFPIIPGYQLLEELGRGGMGVVYKARESGLNTNTRFVAIKMISARHDPTPEELLRFDTEANSVAAIAHENVIRLYSANKHEGRPYCVLEYADSGSLAEFLKRQTLQATEAAALMLTLTKSLQAVHDQGILHRDLKPANILLQRIQPLQLEGSALHGQLRIGAFVPKISDFGLAKLLVRNDGLTATGKPLGTPSYMAPEQAEGRIQDVGTPTDVYGLGAILFELLTQRPPFCGDNDLATLKLVSTEKPQSVRKLKPEVPEELETICANCLEKRPSDRCTTRELVANLNRFLGNNTGSKATAGQSVAGSLRSRTIENARDKWRIAVIQGLVAFVVGLVFWFSSDWVGCGTFKTHVELVMNNGEIHTRAIKLGYTQQLNYGPWYVGICPFLFWLAGLLATQTRRLESCSDSCASDCQRKAMLRDRLALIAIFGTFTSAAVYTEWNDFNSDKQLGLGWVQAEFFQECAARLRAGEQKIDISNRRFDLFQIEDGPELKRVRAKQVSITNVSREGLTIRSHAAMVVFVIFAKAWAGFWEALAVYVSFVLLMRAYKHVSSPISTHGLREFFDQWRSILRCLLGISLLGGLFNYMRFVANVLKGSFALSDWDKLLSLVALFPGMVAVFLTAKLLARKDGFFPGRITLFLFLCWLGVWIIVIRTLLGYLDPETLVMLRHLFQTLSY